MDLEPDFIDEPSGASESKTSESKTSESKPSESKPSESKMDESPCLDETREDYEPIKVISMEGTEMLLHGLLGKLSNLFLTMPEPPTKDDPVCLPISAAHLTRVQSYLCEIHRVGRLTEHSFPMRPFDYISDPRIVPHFTTSFVWKGPFFEPIRTTEDSSFTLSFAIRKFMEKAKYTPFEIDFVASDDLDEAKNFFLAVSFLGIPHLDKLAGIPIGVWGFYFPDRPEIVESYLGIESGMTEDERASRLKTNRDILTRVYG